MSGPGFIAVSRSLWDDPDFRDAEMSEREAFLWMLANAVWKAHTVRRAGVTVDLERGQLAFSIRFLAGKWHWHRSRVERFLNVLKNRDTIRVNTETGVCVITFCNYDKYQSAPKAGETEARQKRDATETKKNNTTSKQEEESLLTGDGPGHESDGEFRQLWDEWSKTEMGRKRSKSKAQVYAIFCRKRTEHGFGKILVGARAYVSSDDAARSGGQALDRWLTDQKFLAWMDAAVPTAVSASPAGGLRALGVSI